MVMCYLFLIKRLLSNISPFLCDFFISSFLTIILLWLIHMPTFTQFESGIWTSLILGSCWILVMSLKPLKLFFAKSIEIKALIWLILSLLGLNPWYTYSKLHLNFLSFSFEHFKLSTKFLKVAIFFFCVFTQ
jgi:hypothetical protein